MSTHSKHALCYAALGAILLCVPWPAVAQYAKEPRKALTTLSRPELLGLIHCLRHCNNNDWLGGPFDGLRRLRLRYEVIGPASDRPGFDVVVGVYSERANFGRLFDLNWDGTRCGNFAIVNDAEFAKVRTTWAMTSDPLGGLGTRRWLAKSLRIAMTRGHAVSIDGEGRDKGCGDWSTYW